ncbi:MAG TPA: UDP-2,3-diacylglucosamine diphosphatase LpxI [Desulfobacterales bacterium]|nr:UDP-2,3-diacylglucosamine diphosphatase LpxI [Desulfobacterales bacterium]
MDLRLGLIAGGGQFPLIFSKRAKKKGFIVFAAAYIHEADPRLKDHVDGIEWVHLGQVRRLIRYFKLNLVSEAVMIGTIRKTRIFSDVKPDTKAISLILGMKHTHDDGILRAFAGALEKGGIKILASTFLLPELLAPSGCWTKRKPNRSEKSDIELGWRSAKEIGRLDIGQCVVVGGGSILAVEAIDGTDATIKRGATLGSGTAVVVKTCKPNQDIRFDMPAVGADTIEIMNRAGAVVLAVEAQKVVVFDRKEMIDLANQVNIAIIAMDEAERAR